ncbi:MAG: DUF4190 domain-containing protein [Chthoniobacter sp.]|nr:DUF4190 domain-containing protein [Chthoniobacter sp.]
MAPLPDNPPNGQRPRFSKLAGAAILLAPLLAYGAVGIILYLVFGEFESGWDGLVQLIGFVFWAHVAVIGGSISAALAIILGCVALRQIRKRPDELSGHRQARAAVIISVISLVGVWGVIGGVAWVSASREANLRARAEDIRAPFRAVVQYAQNSGTFPDTLEQVTSSDTASRYIYLGKNLPSEYANYQTEGSQSIVVMYATHSEAGKFVAICANGMTHEWTKPILDGALRASDTLRNSRGIGATGKQVQKSTLAE